MIPLLFALCSFTAVAQPPADRADADRLVAEAEAQLEKGVAIEVRQALVKFETAAGSFRHMGDPGREARALSGAGQCHLHLGQVREARSVLECALPLSLTAGDRALEAEILGTLGEAHFTLGERRRALEFLARGEVLLTALGDREHLVPNWNSTAQAYDELGEQRIALDYLGQAFVLAREAGNRLYEGVIVAGMGKIADDLGEWQLALDSYRHALAAARAEQNVRGESVMLNNIGLTYYNVGDLDESARYLEDALVLRRRVGDKRGEARTLTALGRISFDRGDLEKAAERCQAALDLSRAAGDRSGVATAHSRRSDLFDALGRRAEARTEQAEALRIRQELGDIRSATWSLTRVAALDGALGEIDRAFENFGRALELRRSLKDVPGEIDVLLGRAALERDLGRLAEASDDVAHAISNIEKLRTSVASPALRATYLAKVRAAFLLDIDVKMRRHRAQSGAGFDAQAFEASERMRARSLLDVLSEAGSGIREGVDTWLLSRSRDIQRTVNAKLERQIRLNASGPGGAESAALDREIRALMSELEEVESRIRTSSPRYAALSHAEPRGLEQIRRLVLDDDTLLLSFVLGDVRSFLFTVGTSSLESRELPPRASIEATARRLLQAVKARNEPSPAETAPARKARRMKSEAEFNTAAGDLSRLLFGPLTESLANRRLAIVPDGVLQYVPFAALPVARAEGGPVRPLVVDHEIVTLPSASSLVLMRRDLERRPPAPQAVIVLADPVFDADDERVTARAGGARSRTRPPMDTLLRSATEAGFADGRLPRLPFTRREAAAIFRLVPPNDRREALDFDASRETATSSDLANFRFVHFATHGFLNARHPELSGIVLSLVDRTGQDRAGFLSAVDVYNLKLNADLVVLSGCQTALGREVGGEGLLGLARGFVYAGAPRVLASLWKVDDAATAQLMGKLYEGMLGPGRLTPSAALRAAQLTLLKSGRWVTPVDWAPFVLLGDWR